MSPKHLEEFASGLTGLLVEKNLSGQTLQVDCKVNFNPSLIGIKLQETKVLCFFKFSIIEKVLVFH